MSNITGQIVHLAMDAYGDRLSSVRGHVSNGDQLDAMRAALEVAEVAWTKSTPEHQTDMLIARTVLNQVVVPGAQPVEAVDEPRQDIRARIGCESEDEWFVTLVHGGHTVRTAKVFPTREGAEKYMEGVNLWLNVDADLAHPRPTVPNGYTLIWEPELAALRDRDYVFHDADRGGHLWYWQGDGADIPESLTCSVVMSADTLRELVAKAAAMGEQAGEVVWPKKMQDRADGSHVYGSGYKAALKDASDHLAAQARPVGVPDEMGSEDDPKGARYRRAPERIAYRRGWNDCRSAMLAAAPEVRS
jgi:hypothetical protein